jgi:diguanylate cyclase (GGDEF)-like protein
VIGRLGGDEFVVAGQFDADEIASAMARLRSAASTRKEIAGKRIALSLSLGYASTEHGSADTLKTVVARADKKMYMEKREKKRAAGPIAN